MTTPEVTSNDKAQIVPEEVSNKMDDNIRKLLTLFVILANVIAVVSLILAIVGVSRKDSNVFNIGAAGTGDGRSDGEKTWLIHIGHFLSRSQYLDEESGTIKGYDIDVANAVCQIANKNCALVGDLYENCWNSQAGERSRGGQGLMGGWYDGCLGWVHSVDRARTYSFSNSFAQPPALAIWTLTDSNFPSFPSLAGLKIGFVDGWFADEHCLDRYPTEITDLDVGNVNQVFHYQTQEALLAGLKDSEIQVAFTSVNQWSIDHPELKMLWQADENRCLQGGVGLMTRKNQFELLTWWNAAFERLQATSQYDDICDRLDTDHGDQPGFSADFTCV